MGTTERSTNDDDAGNDSGEAVVADSNQVNRKDKTPDTESVTIEINTKNEQIPIDESSSSSSSSPICRICHLGDDDDSVSELIQLGCGCKDELGFSHVKCAETWFNQKGNIRCEICGMIAKNIRINIEEDEEEMRRRIYMVEFNDMRFMEPVAINMNFPPPSSAGSSHKYHRAICNILMASLILIFFLPWFLHMDIF